MNFTEFSEMGEVSGSVKLHIADSWGKPETQSFFFGGGGQ